MPTDLLADLNEQQRLAVTHTGSPLLVVAGAGSGKTRVLTRRIAYLLAEQQVLPSEVLAITFTNKAAGEMKERVAELVGPTARAMWVSTFHSACVRILRTEGHALGFKSSFTIYDQQDAVRLMTIVARDLGIEPRQITPKSLLAAVSNLKNELIDYETAAARAIAPIEQVVAEAYSEYQRRLMASGAMDFDDLISHTVALLQSFPQVAQFYHRKFRHILVDEYQDTNRAQYVLIRALVGDGSDGVTPAELCVVGDADQSIYAFRGADIRNISEFERDFPGARAILLEQNYRSTQNILSAANAVIRNNPARYAKQLWTDSGAGPKITVYTAGDEHDEADFIVSQLDHLRDEHGMAYRDVAVFYRTNSQSRAIEERFMRRGIPYRLIGGTRFYERKEIRDAIAYLRTIVNPDDEVSLRRILNTPKRGIGDAAEGAVENFARRERSTFDTALHRVDEVIGLAVRSANSIRAFTKLLDDLRTLDESGAPPSAVLTAVYETTGLLAELRQSKDPQDEVRVENLGELENVVREYEASAEEPTLAAFLDQVSLVADSDELPDYDETGGVVTLMTLHTAKGLEFPVVFLTGMEENLFPHARSRNSEGEIEEERRLAYVGMTRAMQWLYLSHAITRATWGQPMANPQSRFLTEIPDEFLDRVGETAPRRASTGAASMVSPKRTVDIVQLAPGDRVSHDKFGLGKVIAVNGAGERAEATIDFGSVGQKRLLLRYAPVEKL